MITITLKSKRNTFGDFMIISIPGEIDTVLGHTQKKIQMGREDDMWKGIIIFEVDHVIYRLTLDQFFSSVSTCEFKIVDFFLYNVDKIEIPIRSYEEALRFSSIFPVLTEKLVFNKWPK